MTDLKNKGVTLLVTFDNVKLYILNNFINVNGGESEETVGNEFDYDDITVCQTYLQAFHGVVLELFIRKYLCKKYNVELRDQRSETIINADDFDDGSYIREMLKKAYEVYKNQNLGAIDIMDEIKIVALTHRRTQKEIPEHLENAKNMKVNVDNLNGVISYLDSLTFKRMIPKRSRPLHLSNGTYWGVPDYKFDDFTFCQILTSRYTDGVDEKLCKLFLYALTDYNLAMEKEPKSYTLMVYNCVLGKKYTKVVTFNEQLCKDLVRILGQLADEN